MSSITIGYELDPRAGFGFHIGQHPTDYLGQRPVNVDLEAPLITIAPTGAGKGVSAIIPTLLTTGANLVVVDPKGEAYDVTAAYRRSLGRTVHRLDPFGLFDADEGAPGASLNPLDLIRPGTAYEDALTLATALCPTLSARDPFWDESARQFVAGVLLWIALHAPAEFRHLGTARRVIYAEPGAFAGVIAAMLDTQAADGMVADAAASILGMPERTRSSVLATAQQHLALLGSSAVLRSVRGSSVSLDGLRDGTAIDIFIVLPMDRLESHSRLLRLWLSVAIQTIARRRRLPFERTLMIVDEAAALGPLEALRIAVTQMRGFGLTPWLIYQDLSQMRAQYPLEWPTLINNAAVVQAFGARTRLAANEIANVLGWSGDMLALPPRQQIVGLAGRAPGALCRLDYRHDPQFRGRFAPNRYFTGRLNATPSTAIGVVRDDR